jgi:hypothetical protein
VEGELLEPQPEDRVDRSISQSQSQNTSKRQEVKTTRLKLKGTTQEATTRKITRIIRLLVRTRRDSSTRNQ